MKPNKMYPTVGQRIFSALRGHLTSLGIPLCRAIRDYRVPKCWVVVSGEKIKVTKFSFDIGNEIEPLVNKRVRMVIPDLLALEAKE